MNCKDCCQDCQRIGCDIELECSGYVEPSNGTKERMDERLAMMHRLYQESEEKHIFAQSEPITNADRIRAMTDEELAQFVAVEIFKHQHCLREVELEDGRIGCLEPDCKECWLEWLKQESGDG